MITNYDNSKSITAKYILITSKLGEVLAKNVEVEVFDPKLTANTFNYKKHQHLISSKVSEKYCTLIATDFYREHFFSVYLGYKKLTADEVSGVRIELGVNAQKLAMLLGVSKGTISKILSGKISIKTPESILLMSLLKEKLDKHDLGQFLKKLELEELHLNKKAS